MVTAMMTGTMAEMGGMMGGGMLLGGLLVLVILLLGIAALLKYLFSS